MVRKKAPVKRREQSRNGLRRFFLDGKPYGIIRVEPKTNSCFAWDFDEGERVFFLWSDVKRFAQPGYKLSEVCRMLNVDRNVVMDAVRKGDAPAPRRLPPIGLKAIPENLNDNHHQYFSTDDIIQVWEGLMVRHCGRPRKDGGITPNPHITSKAELIAFLTDAVVLYTKNNDGEFTPVWRPPRMDR